VIDTVLFVVRHGRTPMDKAGRSDGYLDLPMSDEGRLQMVETQQQLKNIEFKEIHSSDLKRAHESAHIIAKPRDLKVTQHKQFRPWNLGKLAGTPKQPNRPQVEWYLNNPDRRPPEGDSIDEFRKSFRPAFKALLARAKQHGPILVVTSGSDIRDISEMLFKDRDLIDVDEAGIVALYPSGKTGWSFQILKGGKKDHDEAS